MPVLGLIKEGKVPSDNRVALTPKQCKWLLEQHPDWDILVESSATRCYKDIEYQREGIKVVEDISSAEILFGIKEVPKTQLIPNKTYLFFSHTKKAQSFNQALFHTMMDKQITLIDYECLEHEDGQRLIGFGFFAGIVGAHNGIMAYGNRTKEFTLGRVKDVKDYMELIHTYFGLKLPPIKIAVTGSGRVAHGILEIMNLMDVQQVEPDEFKTRTYPYPVYVHLKGKDLYKRKDNGSYERNDFHNHPENYECLFKEYLPHAKILMNGVYWEKGIPPLFTLEELKDENSVLTTIADITDDAFGSVPCNLGDASSDDPIYGVQLDSCEKCNPYNYNCVDIMAVGNLPNELPRDASRFFGEQLIKYVLGDLVKGGNPIIEKATMLNKGKLTDYYNYLAEYAQH
ncbi:MAG: NAD(P)-dependent oxidoreductase [Sediminibacterium sp.]